MKLFATILLSTFAASAIAAGADANCPVTPQVQPPFVPPAPCAQRSTGLILVWNKNLVDLVAHGEYVAQRRRKIIPLARGL
jgi:hypothetical protein